MIFFTHVACSHYASEIEGFFITTKCTFEPILKICQKIFGTSEHVLTKGPKTMAIQPMEAVTKFLVLYINLFPSNVNECS